MVAKRAGRPNLNEASREELVEVAGVKPETAETIVRLRSEHGPVDNLEPLRQHAKFGEAEVSKLTKTFEVAGEAAKQVASEAAEQGRAAVEQAGNAARDLSRKGAETAQRLSETTGAMAQDALDKAGEAGKQFAEGLTPVARLGWLWLSYWPEQTAQGVAAAQRLLQCRSWPEVVQVQSDFALASIDRLARGFASGSDLVANQTDRVSRSATKNRAA